MRLVSDSDELQTSEKKWGFVANKSLSIALNSSLQPAPSPHPIGRGHRERGCFQGNERSVPFSQIASEILRPELYRQDLSKIRLGQLPF